MKCQSLFSRKSKKNISNCRLLKLLLSMQSVKTKFETIFGDQSVIYTIVIYVLYLKYKSGYSSRVVLYEERVEWKCSGIFFSCLCLVCAWVWAGAYARAPASLNVALNTGDQSYDHGVRELKTSFLSSFLAEISRQRQFHQVLDRLTPALFTLAKEMLKRRFYNYFSMKFHPKNLPQYFQITYSFVKCSC